MSDLDTKDKYCCDKCEALRKRGLWIRCECKKCKQ